MTYTMVLFLLICGHFLGDFGLQSDYISKAKNPFNPLPNTPWIWPMIAHCSIHGLFVALITNSVFLGTAEIVMHFHIDFSKCKRISEGEDPTHLYNADQVAHILCKVVLFCLYVLINQK